MGICGSFFAIRIMESHFFLGGFSGLSALYVVTTFSILYEKAFRIPADFSRVKTRMQVIVKIANFLREKEEMERVIWGISSIGIKVGSFYTLERISTPKDPIRLMHNIGPTTHTSARFSQC
jgi:hypothetical protein